jgi:hypothetical protein
MEQRTNLITHPYGRSEYVIEVVLPPKSYMPRSAVRVLGLIEERLGFNPNGEDSVRLRQGSIEGIYVKVRRIDEDLEKEILWNYHKRKKKS